MTLELCEDSKTTPYLRFLLSGFRHGLSSALCRQYLTQMMCLHLGRSIFDHLETDRLHDLLRHHVSASKEIMSVPTSRSRLCHVMLRCTKEQVLHSLVFLELQWPERHAHQMQTVSWQDRGCCCPRCWGLNMMLGLLSACVPDRCAT